MLDTSPSSRSSSGNGRARARWVAAVVALLLAGAAAPGRGEDAEAIVRHGIDLRRQGHDADALAEFQRAMQIQPSARTRAQVALAEQALGLWPAAEADLLAALGDKSDAWIKKNRATLNAALATIQSHLGTLEVWGTPAGATVYINEKAVGTLPLAKPIRVAGDSVVLGVRATGYLDAAPRTLRVPEGQTVREHVELVPAPPAQAAADGGDKKPLAARPADDSGGAPSPIVVHSSPPGGPADTSRSKLRPLAWGVGVAAAAALAFGVIETVALVHDQNAFNDYEWVDPNDSSHRIKNYCGTAGIPAECKPLESAYDRSRTLTIVGYAGAVALGAGAVTLFLLSAPGGGRSMESASAAPAPPAFACAPDAVNRGVSCLLRF